MFQAWLVKIAKIAANSAPSTRPGASAIKNTTVTEMNPRIGTDCRISSSGMSSRSACLLLAASVAYVKVKRSDSTSAISMRSVVRAAYSGRFLGSSDIGSRCNSDNGWSRCRLASARNTSRPRINSTASTSQRVKKRPPTEIGTFSRMRLPDPLGVTRSMSQLRHEKRGPKAPFPAARLARSHNTGAPLFKHYCALYLRGNLNGAQAGASLRSCSIAESPSVDCCVSGGSAGA